jgi:hypothetical protein
VKQINSPYDSFGRPLESGVTWQVGAGGSARARRCPVPAESGPARPVEATAALDGASLRGRFRGQVFTFKLLPLSAASLVGW